ncbi:MAG: hypothetical protein ABIV51_08750 [Saprospiraceae bacterium]
MNLRKQADTKHQDNLLLGVELAGKHVKFMISEDINSLADEWRIASPADNVFLQLSYLQCVHLDPPPGMTFVYQVSFIAGQAIGVAYYQVRHFDAYQSIKADKEANRSWWQVPTLWVRGIIAKSVSLRTLIAGNLMLTGEHHAYFAPEIDKDFQTKMTLQGIQNVQRHLASKGTSAPLLLIKDYYPGNELDIKQVKEAGIHPFFVQPNMVLHIDHRWNKFSDYVENLHSKYRVRMKRAFKKSEGIQVRPLNKEQTEELMPGIYALYKRTLGNAGFNVVDLNPSYLIELHDFLHDKYTINACFYKDELIAFFTLIKNGQDLEAHFLGMDAEINRNFQLYLTNLFRIVETGILGDCKRIIFARTAIEIKSSIGAIPIDMTCYMKHQNGIVNYFVPTLIKLLNPMEKWVMRNPFKH